MRLVAVECIALALGDAVLDARRFHAFFGADGLNKVQKTVIAGFHLIHVGGGPARRADPHFTLAVAIAVHQRCDVRAAKIGDVCDVVGFAERF